MDRRTTLKAFGLAGAALALRRYSFLDIAAYEGALTDQDEITRQLDRLKDEPAARSEVRVERGGPRLFVNDSEVYPFLGMSTELLKTVEGYRKSGINLLQPIVGMTEAWKSPGSYDFGKIDGYLAGLLAANPDAYFLPRVHLNVPRWWKDAHQDELARFGLPVNKEEYQLKDVYGEGGLNWNSLIDVYDVSLASELWKKEMGDVLRAFLRHIAGSPLKSRIIGHMPVGSMTAEWHYIGSRYIPDYSEPFKKAAGPVPDAAARMSTTSGLLRDPAQEKDIIEFYERYHANTARTVIHFAGIIKEETSRSLICGTFFTYLLENVMIQEAGHLTPELMLNSRDIDFLASPYSYEMCNIKGRPRWQSDVVDESGNWLGRARGVGGDGGYRVLLESLKRHGKLFFAELDPSTYLEPVKTGEGGSGHDSVDGTLKILDRDIAQVFAQGVGGWLFDFGHLPWKYEAHRGWYDDAPMHKEIRKLVAAGSRRPTNDISSVAEIAGVYDAKSFFATAHWTQEKPYENFGISITDFFNHWFLNTQARTLHRIGAPMDFLYRFDLTREDPLRYKLMFMVNLFYLTPAEAENLRSLLKSSGTTVVWYYAPGYITPDKFDLSQMEKLTGFRFSVLRQPAPMLIRADLPDGNRRITTTFGVKKEHWPRFSVVDTEATVLGQWADNGTTAFASKDMDGWTSIYAGCAPLTVDVLRWLAAKAGVRLWSTKADVVNATRDAAMIVATEKGERVLTLPHAMMAVEGGDASAEHRLDLEFGEVRMFSRS